MTVNKLLPTDTFLDMYNKMNEMADTLNVDESTYADATGSSSAYLLALTPTLDSYTEGLIVSFKANHTNTGNVTLNIDGLGVISIFKEAGSTQLIASDIQTGQVVRVIYDGTKFHMISQTAVTTLTDNSVTLDKVASGTAGEVNTYDGSGNPTTAGAGTSGHVLVSQGAGSVPIMGQVNTSGVADRAIGLQQTATGTVGELTSYDGSGNPIAVPSNTTGLPLLSNSSTSAPAFGQLDTGGVADDAIALSKVAPGTPGHMNLYDNAGNPTTLAPGTDDYVLTSNGAGAEPTFQLGGSWKLLGSVTASNSANVTITNIPATWETLVIRFESFVPQTASSTLKMLISNNNGSTYATTGYFSTVHALGRTSINYTSGIDGFFLSPAAYATDPTNVTSGFVFLHSFGTATEYSTISGHGTTYVPTLLDSTYMRGMNIFGTRETQEAINAIKIQWSSGNILSGNLYVYGMK